MKLWKKTIASLAVVAVTFVSLVAGGCGGSEADQDLAESTIVVEVIRGNLMTTISSFGSISMPHQAQLTFGSSGSVSEVNAEFGDSVKEGQVLARLDTSTLRRSITQAEADLRTAQINLEKTREPSSTADIARAEAAVESAMSDLVSAEELLKDSQSPFSDLEIADAEASVRDAQVALENARRTLTVAQQNKEISITDAEKVVSDAEKAHNDFVQANIAYLSIPAVVEQKDTLWWNVEKAGENLEIAKTQAASSIATAENNVIKAKEMLAREEEDLAGMVADPVLIQQKESVVATAKAALAKAEEDMAEIKAGPDPQDIELKQIQVDNTQLALDEALENLEEATIIAPYDGIVASAGVDVGDEVAAGDTIVHLVNTSVVDVDAAVDEIDVASVETGQMAILELDALPDAKLRGQVSAVSPIAASQSSVVTFDIAVAVQDADQYELKEGMSATITIMALDVQDVLLVPSNAIQRTAEGNVVEVVISDDQTEERSVEIGAGNGQQTEIVRGLVEGEQVVVQSSSGDMVDIMEQGGWIPGMGGGGMGGRQK